MSTGIHHKDGAIQTRYLPSSVSGLTAYDHYHSHVSYHIYSQSPLLLYQLDDLDNHCSHNDTAYYDYFHIVLPLSVYLL